MMEGAGMVLRNVTTVIGLLPAFAKSDAENFSEIPPPFLRDLQVDQQLTRVRTTLFFCKNIK